MIDGNLVGGGVSVSRRVMGWTWRWLLVDVAEVEIVFALEECMCWLCWVVYVVLVVAIDGRLKLGE